MKTIWAHWRGVTLAALLLGAGAARAEEFTEESLKTFPLREGAPVKVENINGKVEIIAWDEQYAEVRAIKRTRKSRSELDRAIIETDVSAGLHVRTTFLKGRPGDERFLSRVFGSVQTNPQVTVDYDIRIPRTARIDLAKTVNGSIILRATRGNATLLSTNGSISAEDVEHIQRAKLTNGGISLIAATIGSAETTNGNISATLTAPSSGGIRLASVNGSIALTLPSGVNADVELRTVNGRISTPDGLTLGQGNISSRRVSGKIGLGGGAISASTINGSISIQTDRTQ